MRRVPAGHDIEPVSPPPRDQARAGVIQLHSAAGPQRLNDWLLDRGLALPAFYSSARIDEIDRLTAIAVDASRNDRGIWDVYRNQIEAFDPDLVRSGCATMRTAPDVRPALRPAARGRRSWRFRFRELTGFTRTDAAKDRQRLTTPKLFRRQAAWEAARLAKLPVATTLQEFMGSGSGNEYVTLEDFRLQELEAAPTRIPGDLIRSSGRLRLRPEQIIQGGAVNVGRSGRRADHRLVARSSRQVEYRSEALDKSPRERAA